MSFDALLKSIDDAQKLATTAAAAATVDPNAAAAAAAGDPNAADPAAVLAKSFSFTLEDGSVVEAADGTELVKSMLERLGKHETGTVTVMAKAIELITAQGKQLQAMGERIEVLAKAGVGRKAIVTVNGGATTMAKSEPEGITPEVFMLKADAAFNAGKITGAEISLAEQCINNGQMVPDGIALRVLS
jgi:hypothetical protein